MTPAAPLIALLLCDRCGHSPLPPHRPHDPVCTCRPDNPAELAEIVAIRHRASVQLAREHDVWRRRYPAWSNQ